jgi:hypothetical protein
MNRYQGTRLALTILLTVIFNLPSLWAQTFTEQTGILLKGALGGSIAWGDYDNDGDLDILLTGYQNYSYFTKIYRNNGDNTFTEQTSISLPDIDDSSVAWGDYDNDGNLDILLTGWSSAGRISKIYRNNGNSSFSEQTSILLRPVMEGSIAWGDYDNDGDLDILLTGDNASSPFYNALIYRNDGNNTFSVQTGISLTGVSKSSAAWGDYDNDGDLDILLTGNSGSTKVTKLYRNNGNNTFTDVYAYWFTGVDESSVAWGDYNNDGYLDILLTGNTGSAYVSKVYKNNGNNTFTDQGFGLTGVYAGSCAWGDYDNDGDLDILLTGNTGSTRISKVYRNNGNNSFSEQTNILLTGVDASSVAWADYDNDGDLDILLTGNTSSGSISKIYRNDISTHNTVPDAPTGLASTISANVILRWNPVKTDATPAKGMMYNIRVGTSPGASDIVNPMAAGNGFRRLPNLGNGQLDTTFILSNLKKATYYWSVQAIDDNFAGGAFSPDQSFFNITPASALAFSNITTTSIKCSWKRGQGDKCVVFVRENGEGKANPGNNITFINDSAFGKGTQINSSGWYCVYNGIGNSVTITGLKILTNYAFHVIEYTGNAGSEQYLANDEPTAHITQSTGLFTGQTGISIPGFAWSSAAWGDYDNDGDLDILLTGTTSSGNISRVYRNNGNNTFSEQTGIILTGVNESSVAWGDYDNDGDLDILLAGNVTTGSPYISKVYRNNGNNTFTEQTQIILTGVHDGTVAWGDYDNDGDLDILLNGYTGSTYVSKIYQNNGDNTFTEQTSIQLAGVSSTGSWVDYDNDGDLDILLTGYTGTSLISKIYRNNGNKTFTEQSGINLTGVQSSCTAWGDYNNDGNLDLLLTGWSGTNNIARIYKNNGNNTFTEQTGINLIGIAGGSVAWGDCNNDGDLDIILTGQAATGPISRIYVNNGNNIFSEQGGIFLKDVSCSAVAFGDYDNDGDLDLLLTGYTGSGYFTQIYRNDIPVHNNIPSPPTGVNSAIGTDAVLKWKPVTTDETPAKGITYNIRIGRSPGASDVVSPMANTSGKRQLSSMGNAQTDTTFLLHKPKKGTYYWSVQSIDNNFAGSVFSSEQTLQYNKDCPALLLNLTNVTTSSVRCTWERGNGDKCILFVKEKGTGTANPTNNSTYIGNTTFGLGSQIGNSGWYCVYNGNKDSITVTGLKGLTDYAFHVLEYTGNAGNEQYSTAIEPTAHSIETTKLFSDQTCASLLNIEAKSILWGDYDNDGDLDLLAIEVSKLGSYSMTKIYRNDGNNIFSEQTGISLPSLEVSSAAWGDYNNDGYLDIVLTGSSVGNGRVSKIYRNNGNNTFSEQKGILLTGVSEGSVAWGDYDNDGDLDLLLTGNTGYGYISKIYKNNGNSTFTEQTGISLEGVFAGSISWVDYDNDGDLDIMLTGHRLSDCVSRIYRNNGDNTFSQQTGISLTGVYYSSVDWGDYDNDGDLDILLSGTTGTNPVSKIYRNNGDNTFSEQTNISLIDVSNGLASWGDYDNDGDLDILLSGVRGTSIFDYVTKIYRNNGNNDFSEQINTSLYGSTKGSFAWGDYDNDGDLDVLLTGSSYTDIKIYRNDIYPKNIVPSPPSDLTATNGINVTLQWKAVTTDYTPQNSMKYNIRVGTTPGGSDVVSPMSANNGFRRLTDLGNAQLDTCFIIKNLKRATYYWSVQAIDNNMAGGAFAPEQTFIYYAPATTLTFADITTTSIKCKWKRGQGDKCIVFAKENSTGTATPVNNTTYTANTVFGNGSQLGTTGWHCIYNSTADSVIVTGLKPLTNYAFHVIEYVGNSGAELYSSVEVASAHSIQSTDLFSPQITIPCSGYNSMPAWGDYDNDGYLDILITGNNGSGNVTKIYRNNGNNTFTEQSGISLAGINGGSVTWADYDNDGYLDILITGWAGSPISKIYRNNGNNTFSEQTGISLTGVYDSSVAWGDYNNDGKPDILLTGFRNTTGLPDSSGYTYLTKLYQNNGNNSFTEQDNFSLPGIDSCSVAWVDYNNDGYMDITSSRFRQQYFLFPRAKVYQNNGDNTFTRQEDIQLKGFIDGSQTCGDFDNDGDLDYLLSNYGSKGTYTTIYRNNGDDTYNQQTCISQQGAYRSYLIPADYDNDGDLDLLIIGYDNNGYFTRIYRNDIIQHNAAPDAPNSLSSYINSSDVKLTWNRGKDDFTPKMKLLYNVRVGTSPGAYDIVSPMSANNGFRRIVGQCNAQTDTLFILRNLKNGTYFWSVQSIDNSSIGGTFAPEQSFTVYGTGIPDLRKSGITMYPNPVNEFLYIDNVSENCDLTIFTAQGNLIKNQLLTIGKNEIHVSELPSGLYLLILKTGHNDFQTKLIKQ